MKKQYMKPSMKAIKLDSTDIICGSGTDTQSLRMGGNPSDDDDAPAQTSGWGYTGIWGE